MPLCCSQNGLSCLLHCIKQWVDWVEVASCMLYSPLRSLSSSKCYFLCSLVVQRVTTISRAAQKLSLNHFISGWRTGPFGFCIRRPGHFSKPLFLLGSGLVPLLFWVDRLRLPKRWFQRHWYRCYTLPCAAFNTVLPCSLFPGRKGWLVTRYFITQWTFWPYSNSEGKKHKNYLLQKQEVNKTKNAEEGIQKLLLYEVRFNLNVKNHWKELIQNFKTACFAYLFLPNCTIQLNLKSFETLTKECL
jgi:hypothetical protein